MYPKVQTIKLDTKIAEDQLRAVNTEKQAMEERTDYLKTQYELKLKEFKQLTEQTQELSDRLSKQALVFEERLQDQVNIYNQEYYKQIRQIEYDYQNEKEDLIQAHTEAAKDIVLQTQKRVNEYQLLEKELNQKTQEAKANLDDIHKKVLAAVEANKRAEEIKNKETFYKLNLTEKDLIEIKEIKNSLYNIKNPEPIYKALWKMYYEKPYTDLIGRVIGSGIHCGIYKITNLKNGMCYVGQSVNIAERWKQHIKRGMGADTPTRNKLYPAMNQYGVENFTFEIIEECGSDKLNERELYWQEYFKAKEFGYSIK